MNKGKGGTETFLKIKILQNIHIYFLLTSRKSTIPITKIALEKTNVKCFNRILLNMIIQSIPNCTSAFSPLPPWPSYTPKKATFSLPSNKGMTLCTSSILVLRVGFCNKEDQCYYAYIHEEVYKSPYHSPNSNSIGNNSPSNRNEPK